MKTGEAHSLHPAHARVWELLPWYHNDALDTAARAAVDSHLGECLVCVREVRRLRQLTAALSAPANEHACAHGFMRLSAQIQARQSSWRGRLLGLVQRLAVPVPLVAATAVLALGVLLVLRQDGAETPLAVATERSFQTLGRQATLPPANLSHPLFRIVLRDALDRDHVQQWLSRHDAELIEGPSEIGVMTVKLALGSRDAERALEAVRGDSATLFAEPLNAIGARPDRRR